MVKILRVICRLGSCCKPSSGLGNKWRNQDGDKEEVAGQMLTKTYEVLGEVWTRMMPMTTMMPMKLNEGVDDDDADGVE